VKAGFSQKQLLGVGCGPLTHNHLKPPICCTPLVTLYSNLSQAQLPSKALNIDLPDSMTCHKLAQFMSGKLDYNNPSSHLCRELLILLISIEVSYIIAHRRNIKHKTHQSRRYLLNSKRGWRVSQTTMSSIAGPGIRLRIRSITSERPNTSPTRNAT
jgi:hypothetical protein